MGDEKDWVDEKTGLMNCMVDELTVDESSYYYRVDEMTVDELTVDERT